MMERAADCPVCLDSFDTNARRPTTLACGHSLCEPCGRQLIQRLPASVSSLACPLCQQTTALPPSRELSVNFALCEALDRFRSILPHATATGAPLYPQYVLATQPPQTQPQLQPLSSSPLQHSSGMLSFSSLLPSFHQTVPAGQKPTISLAQPQSQHHSSYQVPHHYLQLSQLPPQQQQQQPSAPSSGDYCTVHNKQIEFVCCHDRSLGCSVCFLSQTSEHYQHPTMAINELANTYRGSLRERTNALEGTMWLCQRQIERLDNARQELVASQRNTIDEIVAWSQAIIAQVSAVRDAALHNVDRACGT